LAQSGGSGGLNDGLSVISETTGFGAMTQFGKISHAEKNLTKLENNRAKDLEKATKELEETKDELSQLKTKYKAAVARRDTLEQQMKDFKGEVQSKMKLLIDKTENDDKLIQLLKSEVKRLETLKGVKSTL
jgi:chromosome segregation ATPase